MVVEYAETVSPAGETSFSTIEDRSSVVTLQRWSMLPALDKTTTVFLLVENLSELHPKLVANPRVATVQIPIPDADSRRDALLRHIRADMGLSELEMMTEVTAGLKNIQIKGILAPHDVPSDDDIESAPKYIAELLGGGPAAVERAQKLAQITKGMPRTEIRRLLAPEGPVPTASQADSDAKNESSPSDRARASARSSSECYSLIEFLDPKHGFEVVGGMDEVKRDLSLIARNIREGPSQPRADGTAVRWTDGNWQDLRR